MSLQPFRSSARKTVRAARLGVEALEDRFLLSCNTISGFVYHDANNNGLYEPSIGESPIANSKLELRNSAGVAVASATSDANGFYKFETDSTLSTAPAVQTHTVTFPSTLTNYDLLKALPQFDPALGTLTEVEITHTGSVTSDIRVENTSDTSDSTVSGNVSGLLTLSGPNFSLTVRPERNTGSFDATVYDGATDFDGTSGFTFAERIAAASRTTRLSGAEISPFVGTGSVEIREVARATSSASGGGNVQVAITSRASATVTVTYHYTPTNCLAPGDYTIVQTEQPPGYEDGQEARDGAVLGNPPGTSVIPVTLTGTDLVNNNFGEVQASSISGYVYWDTSAAGYNDGIKQADEQGIAGATVIVRGTTAAGAYERTLTTDERGYYEALGLVPGTYEIVEIQPAGAVDGKDTIGSQGGSTANDHFHAINLPPNVHGVENNFGELKPVVSATDPEPILPGAGTQEQVVSPIPTTFPGTDVNIIGKVNLFSSSGIDATDPVLRTQIAYVDGLYRTLFGMPADEGGLVYWVRQLRSGVPREQIVQQLADSPMHRGIEVLTLYRTYLGRDPLAGDYQYWGVQLAGGTSLREMALMFISSPEYSMRNATDSAYVTALYSQILGRAPEAGAVQFWGGVIQAGGRAAAAHAIMYSDEANLRALNRIFANHLHRAPSAAEAEYWGGQIRAGLAPEQFCRLVLSSEEFYALARSAVAA